LRGQSDEEIGLLLALGTLIRLNLESEGKLPKQVLDFEIDVGEHAQYQIFVSNLVRQFQKLNQPTDAAGTMIWLHSLRSQGYPELRIKGRELWSELVRGFPYVEHSWWA